MNYEQFVQWINRIYATQDGELNCAHIQAILPQVVEAELSDGKPEANGQKGRHVEAVHLHLLQCPDCLEVYQGLRRVVELEAKGRLPRFEDSPQGLASPAERRPDVPERVRAVAVAGN